MANFKKDKKARDERATSAGAAAATDTFWRKPITLDSFDDEDPLETLYRGREVEDAEREAPQKPEGAVSEPVVKKPKARAASVSPKPGKTAASQKPKAEKTISADAGETDKPARPTRITEDELKNLLKIKSDSFRFTDIREILRGKSFDIYTYLRFLSGEAGVCKIRHLEMMKKLDVSRPTLFKQGDWLARLSLIEKRNVPGDHLGTSYTVYRLEDVLPVPDSLVAQIQAAIDSFVNKNG